MTKLQLIKKNLKLSSRLTKYLVSNPKELKKFPDDASIVTFSAKDIDLNKMNEKLFQNLKNSGNKVIKAKETKSKSKPWNFAFV